MLLHLALAIALIGVPGMTDDIAARLAKLETDNAQLRGQMGALSMEAVRGSRGKRDAMSMQDANALLGPRSLSRPIGYRAASDSVPDLGMPLMARLRDDSGVSTFAGGSTYPMVFANGLVDPSFDLMDDPVAVGTAYTAIGSTWEAKYVLNSGTVATTRNLGIDGTRAQTGETSISSNIAGLNLIFGVNASDMTIYLRPTSAFVLGVAVQLEPSWLTAGIRIWTYSASNVTATAYLEIVDSADTVLAAGDPEDLINLLDLVEHSRLEVGYESPVINTSYRMRLRIDVTKTAGAIGSIIAFMAEPLIAPADEGTAPAFTPAIGAWKPGVPGYQLVPRQYLQANAAAGATSTADIGATGFAQRITEVWGGWLVGISYRWNAAVTNGTFTIRVQDAGSTIWTAFSGATAQGDIATKRPGLIPFSSGSLLTVDVVTTAGFLPAGTNDLIVELWLLVDYAAY